MEKLNSNIAIASFDNLETILNLQKEAFAEVAKFMNNLDLPPISQTIEELQNEFQHFTILKYLSEDNRIVGSVRAFADDMNICHIGKLIVDPDFQNQGIGKALMSTIENYFPLCERFVLFTGDETPNTLHLYQKVGYHIIRKEDMNGVNMFVMEKVKNDKTEKIKFGSSPLEIDDLANKVLSGEKIATSSLLDYHLQGLKKKSEVGDCFSILNSSDKEVGVVKIEKVEIVKFGDITEFFAIEEGDGSLENWQAIHQPYYSKLLSEIGLELNLETLLVCEWFKVIRNNISPNISIREILPEEVYLFEDIMYEAIYHPDKNNPYSKDIIYLPQVRIYWDNWGKEKDDSCLVAVTNNKIAGAVWIRTFLDEIKGCGYIDEQTPEIAVALFDEYRNKGIGTQLMQRMIELMNRKGFAQVSLSITKGNPAINLYFRLGFEVIEENDEDYIMLLKLD